MEQCGEGQRRPDGGVGQRGVERGPDAPGNEGEASGPAVGGRWSHRPRHRPEEGEVGGGAVGGLWGGEGEGRGEGGRRGPGWGTARWMGEGEG